MTLLRYRSSATIYTTNDCSMKSVCLGAEVKLLPSNKIKETVPSGSFDTINEDLICPGHFVPDKSVLLEGL